MQWKDPQQLNQTLHFKRQQISDELGDVFHSLLLLASELKIPLGQALTTKLEKDALKYPIEKARGKNLKYDEL